MALATNSRGKRPVLYGPNGAPLKTAYGYQYQRTAAKREGSLTNWVPKRLISRQNEALERERIVERAIDLVNNDQHDSPPRKRTESHG